MTNNVTGPAIFAASYAAGTFVAKKIKQRKTRRQDRKSQTVANIAMYTK